MLWILLALAACLFIPDLVLLLLWAAMAIVTVAFFVGLFCLLPLQVIVVLATVLVFSNLWAWSR